MSRVKKLLFVTALHELETQAVSMRSSLECELIDPNEEPEIGVVHALDEAIEAVLSTRNQYCQDNELLIEDGSVDWCESQAQIERDKNP